MVRSKRTAFTLVELLVVISIIGMLMALLLPAVGAATESARSATCKNQIKQVALAMASYESRNQSFPGYADGIERQGNVAPHSWMVSIMPDIERQDIYDQYGTDGFQAPFLDFLVCPSDPPLNKTSGHTSYVANAGLAEWDAAGCGIMHTAWPLRYQDRKRRGKKVIHQKTSLDTISSGDGASTTILLSENIQAGLWNDISFFDKDADPEKIPAMKVPSSTPPSNVLVYVNKATPEPAFLINSKVDEDGKLLSPGTRPALSNARPSSEHRGGVNVAFADGHVQFLKEEVDYTVYARLLSPDGKKCNKNVYGFNSRDEIDHEVILSDTDYK